MGMRHLSHRRTDKTTRLGHTSIATSDNSNKVSASLKNKKNSIQIMLMTKNLEQKVSIKDKETNDSNFVQHVTASCQEKVKLVGNYVIRLHRLESQDISF